MKKFSLFAILTLAALLTPGIQALEGSGDATGDSSETQTGFADIVSSRMPGKEVSPFGSFGSMGMAQLIFNLNSPSSFEINRACTEDAILAKGEEIIGRIPAANEDTEPYACAIFGIASMDEYGDATRSVDDGSGLIDPVISISVGFKFGDDPITDEGNYTFTIPDGFFLINGQPITGASYSYHMASYWSSEPANGTEEVALSALKAITITYKAPSVQQGHCKTIWGYDYTDAEYHITYAGEDVSDLYTTSISGSTVTFKLKPGHQFEAKSGKATVSVDHGYFLYGNDQDALFPVSFSFVVGARSEDLTGINGPQSDDTPTVSGAADVWSMEGIRIMKDATQEDLKRLPAGIYIVSGRKIMIK